MAAVNCGSGRRIVVSAWSKCGDHVLGRRGCGGRAFEPSLTARRVLGCDQRESFQKGAAPFRATSIEAAAAMNI